MGDGQGGLACCSPWGQKELATKQEEYEGGRTDDYKGRVGSRCDVKTGHDHYCSSISGLSDRKNDEAYWVKVLISYSTHCEEEGSPAACMNVPSSVPHLTHSSR